MTCYCPVFICRGRRPGSEYALMFWSMSGSVVSVLIYVWKSCLQAALLSVLGSGVQKGWEPSAVFLFIKSSLESIRDWCIDVMLLVPQDWFPWQNMSWRTLFVNMWGGGLRWLKMGFCSLRMWRLHLSSLSEVSWEGKKKSACRDILIFL